MSYKKNNGFKLVPTLLAILFPYIYILYFGYVNLKQSQLSKASAESSTSSD
jgi:hypothetical protein